MGRYVMTALIIGGALSGLIPARAQTPPVAPRTQETPIPPVVTIPAPPTPTPTVPIRPLTADEAARVALRLQPNIALARASILGQQGRTQQVKSGLLPQVTVSASYTHIETLSTEGGGGTGVVTTTTGTGTGTGTTGTGTTGTGTGTSGTGATGTTTGTGTTGTTTGTGTTGTGGTTTGGTTTGGSGTGATSGPTTVTSSGASSTTTGEGALAQATLRQLIYDFNHTRDLVRQSAALERAAEQNLTRVQYDTVLQVKQAFYQLVQNSALVQVNEANVANRQSQLDLATARLNSGLGLPSDVVTAQTAKAEAVLNLTIARSNESVARITLALLMGIDPRTPLQPAESSEAPFTNDDVNGLVQTALQRRPEILEAQFQLRSSQYGVDAARTTNAPVISGNVNVTSRGTNIPPGTDSFSVGIGIQFTPFDGGLTRGKVKEAQANVLSAQASLAATQLNVTSDVATAFSNLRNAELRVPSAQSDVANAEEGVRIAQGRYRAGLGLFLDIINAQAFLLTARTNLVQTNSAVEQARAALRRAIGTPLQ